MSGRILQFGGHRHDEAQRLLPWLLNGTLPDDDHGWVERHVAGCSECRRDCDAERAVQDGFRHADATTAGDGPVGGTPRRRDNADAGWQRIRPRLHASGARAPSRWQWPHRARWLDWAVAAQALVIVVLAATLWQSAARPAYYRTLGAIPPVASGNLVIVFDPHLDEAHLRRLLAASAARIVDGPNAAGAYVIAVPPRRLRQVRDALRAAPGVTLVATLAPEAGR